MMLYNIKGEIDNRGVSIPFFLFVLFHGLYAFTPYIRQTQMAMYIDFVLVFYWALRMFVSSKQYNLNKSMRHAIKIAFIILAISVIYKLTGYSTAKIGQCLRYFGFFATIVLGWFFVNESSNKQKIHMMICYSIIILVNVLYNIVITLPYVAMGMGTEEIIKSGGSDLPNFGDTSFTGYVFFCTVLFFIMACFNKGFINRIVSLVLAAVCGFYTVVCGMRGTTAVLLFVALFLIFATRFLRHWIKNQQAFMITLFLVFLLLLINMDYITDLLIKYAPSDRLAERFKDVQQTREHGFTEDSFSGRGSLLRISIDSFLRNPFTILFGIGEPLVVDSYAMAGISNHSDVIDTFARSGLVGVFLYTRCFYLYFKEMIAKYGNTIWRTLFKIVFWMVPIYGIVKTIFWENFAVVTFIVLPLMLYLLSARNANSISKNH